ncbi:hypothetical protein L3X38_001706 [Prunus dulcis]|uniref:Uncharacterized protein n=1 Tax=Prunus dulcis TaxID=3755 RepID=A0AAD4ZK57_PRUDU|nr:hypothetical protein L3X38_001706 [Prunus dulcis]
MHHSARTRKKRKKPYLTHWVWEAAMGKLWFEPVELVGDSGSGLHDESSGTGLEGWGGRMWRRSGGFRLDEQ